MYFFRFDSFLDVSLDCAYSCCTVIGAMLCFIFFPVIVAHCYEAISHPKLTKCFIMVVVLTIYIFLARAVISGIRNVMCYKINGEVYNIDSERVFNQNQNIEAQNQVQDIIPTAVPIENFESSETDLPPSYTECVILSPPNKVQIPISAPPPPPY